VECAGWTESIESAQLEGKFSTNAFASDFKFLLCGIGKNENNSFSHPCILGTIDY